MQQACGFAAGNDILAFFNMPGVVFALGGRSPGGPWYNGGYPGDRESNAFLLELAGRARVRAAYILENTTEAKVAELLAAFGARFPQDYRLCGSALWPQTGATVRLWKSSTMPDAARADHARTGGSLMPPPSGPLGRSSLASCASPSRVGDETSCIGGGRSGLRATRHPPPLL